MFVENYEEQKEDSVQLPIKNILNETIKLKIILNNWYIKLEKLFSLNYISFA